MENPEGRKRGDRAITDGEKTTGSSVVVATVAAVGVVGPLLGLMSFSLVATVTLFLIVSPLMLIFVPVLTATVTILVAAMVSVGVAGAMWLMGIAALVCCGREIGVGTGVAERMVESVVRELGYGRSRYLREKPEDGSYSQAHSSS
ncbi:hypothetical protein EUTSA_v10014952mg [Eutrema salsugineum]|uniref:Oleosin n=1 Tax=Eutrema salsugineum TaxID=72664 RepID=V4NAH1_EUTSA|nr:uncharacterized protein LOC18019175 [Eutrema salsugineum]ESQ42831.1 hypothetical protein EUTSA_v10014952mg [Eutrema salsugineum]